MVDNHRTHISHCWKVTVMKITRNQCSTGLDLEMVVGIHVHLYVGMTACWDIFGYMYIHRLVCNNRFFSVG